MIAGIEGLATGFLKGLDTRRERDRQDMKDAQDAERFNMDKERFATQQQVDAFNLQNAQTKAGRETADYTRALGIQQKDDAFEAKMKAYVPRAINKDPTLFDDVEKENLAMGIQGQFLRDSSGKIRIDPNGNAMMTGTKDGKSLTMTPDQALESYYNGYHATDTVKNRIASQAEIAKEDRGQKNDLAKLDKTQAGAVTLANIREAGDNRRNAATIKKDLEIASLKSNPDPDPEYNPLIPIATTFFGEKITPKQLMATAKTMPREKFTAIAMQKFNLDNAGKYLTPENKKQAEASLKLLTDGLYGTADGSTGSTTETRDGMPNPTNKNPADNVDMGEIATTPKAETPQQLSRPQSPPRAKPTTTKPISRTEKITLPADYIQSLIDAVPKMPAPKQYPKGTTFFSGNTNPLEQKIILGNR